ncbi:MAG: hypothetical protein J0626_01460, partial [Rhodospirillaceae bacterium]|nr:hypothetical protein [Rhodospirillaceae bacterium]
MRVIYGYLAFPGQVGRPPEREARKGLNMKRIVAAVLTASMLAACSSYSQPMVDTKGVDTSRYSQDNYECEQYANQVSPVGDAAVGALGGA